MSAGSHLPPPPQQKIAAARSFICSDHVRAEQEHRLDGVLLAPGPQVRQEQPHWGEEPLDTGLRHPGAQRERRYRAAPQWGRMGSGSDGAVYRRLIAQCRSKRRVYNQLGNVYHG